jgi:hypothetical protein
VLVQAILAIRCALGDWESFVWGMLVERGKGIEVGLRVGMRVGLVVETWFEMLRCAFYLLFLKLLGLWQFFFG